MGDVADRQGGERGAPLLTLQLLGGLRIDGEAAPRAKPYALLALILAHADSHVSREQCAALLWPDSSDKSARQSLRTVLHQLRTLLPESEQGELIETGRLSLTINPAYPAQVDVVDFARALKSVPATPASPAQREAAIAELARGAEAYRGPFLAGFALNKDLPFDEWVVQQRAWLQGQARRLFHRLSGWYAETGQFDAALEVAASYVSREPEDELGRRSLNAVMARAPAGDGEPEAPGGRLERRWIAAVYCELPLPATEVGEDGLGEIAAARRACREALARRGGWVEGAPGGAMVAYFGKPPASERYVSDACDAALAIAEAGAPGLAGSRAGVHSGWTLMGEGGHPDYAGGVVREAMRLARTAPAGAVRASSATCAGLPPGYQCLPAGDAGENRVLHRAADVPAAFHSPLVGRRSELAVLLRQGRAVARGAAPVLTLRGTAGLGKSRLVAEARYRLGQRVSVRVLCCRQVEREVALAPFRDLLEYLCGVGPESAPATRTQRLRQCLARCRDLDPIHHGPLVWLVDREDDDETAGPGREATLAALVALIRSLAWQPTLLVVEDGHWADDMTRAVLARLATAPGERPLGLWLTTRPEGAALPAGTALDLAPLPPEHIRELVAHAAVPGSLSAEDREWVAAAAEGVPLFAEALARTGEPGDGERPTAERRTEALLARFDQGGAARRVAQLGALVGRDFDAELLAHLEEADTEAIRRALGELEALDLLRASGTAHQPRYAFGHALLEEAAYHSVPPVERSVLHARLADVLPRVHPGEVAARPDWLAWHHERAGQPFPAAECQFQAASRSARLGAHQQALVHLEHARDLLNQAADGPEARALGERVAQFMAVQSLFPRGFRPSEEPAGEGADPADAASHFQTLLARLMHQLAGGSWADLKDRAENLLDVARADGDTDEIRTARHLLGFCANYAGDIPLAEAHFANVLPDGVDEAPLALVQLYNGPPLAVEQAYRALLALRRGRTSEAEALEAQARALARHYGAPNLMAYVLTLSAGFHRYAGQPALVLARAREVAVLSREEGLRATRVIAMGYREWAKAALGRRCGLDRMETVVRHEGSLTVGFSLAAFLAPAYGHCDRRREQIALIRELLAGGEAMALPALYYAELYTLLGEALLATGEAAEGEEWLHRAMEAAHTTGDHRQRLRAALALAEQEGQTGRTAEAARRLQSAVQAYPLEAGDADSERARHLLRHYSAHGEQPQSAPDVRPECDG